MKLNTNMILLLAGAAAAILYFRGESEKKLAAAKLAAAAVPSSPAIKGSVSVGPGGVNVDTDFTLPGGGT